MEAAAETRSRVKELRFALGSASTSTAAADASRKRLRSESGDASSGNSTPPVSIVVRLVELIDELEQAEDDADLHFGLFIWPSALVLAHYVAFHYRDLFNDRVVLELGCGIALPGILAALCGNAKKVILSDRADSQTIQRNVQANIELNGIAHTTQYLPLNWGGVDLLDHVDALQHVDIILAADCFYRSEDFESVLATVTLVFRLNPTCTFVTAYQLRSINRSIAPLLERYKMAARVLHKHAFIADDAMKPGFESVYVYEITSK